MTGRLLLAALVAAVGFSLVVRAQEVAPGDAALQFQLGEVLFGEARYRESLVAFDRATRAADSTLVVRARKGKIRSALRIAEFTMARLEGDLLRQAVPEDADALALYADTLWSSGWFDESDEFYEAALAVDPDSARARFGLARSLASRRQLDQALVEAERALELAPQDGEIHAIVAEIYEREHDFTRAAEFYRRYAELLPASATSEKAAWARARIRFLEAFEGRQPVAIDAEDEAMLHTVPFRLVNDKVVVRVSINGGPQQDFVLDTGSEETILSEETAFVRGIQPITRTLSAGVGEVGLRGLQLGRLDSLSIGTLQVRNLPVLIKNPALQGVPRLEGDAFSPLSLGLSMLIDYQNNTLSIGRRLPVGYPVFLVTMLFKLIALVRGVLNQSYPAYFVVDTGGEVISISQHTAGALEMPPVRRIPLQVWGSSGWDPDAFLLPGVNLAFGDIAYENYPTVVLNLRTPSALLGFQLGGILGHKFLSPYRVTMDMEMSELRLERF
jgi:Flp pilus assembly protein TadD/predicted aspartyl protease